jgi:propanediol dehydratase small subunit
MADDERSNFQASPEALAEQARVARAAGFTQLAENFERAAELTAVPPAELLRVYELLRPGRSSQDELLAAAEMLEEKYGARINAAFVREAAAVYAQRGLYRKDELASPSKRRF